MRTQDTPPQQAYTAQTTLNDRQIILAAEITLDAPEFGLWSRCSARHCANATVGVHEQPEVVIADAGYGTPGRWARSPTGASRG